MGLKKKMIQSTTETVIVCKKKQSQKCNNSKKKVENSKMQTAFEAHAKIICVTRRKSNLRGS